MSKPMVLPISTDAQRATALRFVQSLKLDDAGKKAAADALAAAEVAKDPAFFVPEGWLHGQSVPPVKES